MAAAGPFTHQPTGEEKKLLDQLQTGGGDPGHGDPGKDLHITRIVVYYRPSKDSDQNLQLEIDPAHADLLFWNREYCDFFRVALLSTPPDKRPARFRNKELTVHRGVGSDGVPAGQPRVPAKGRAAPPIRQAHEARVQGPAVPGPVTIPGRQGTGWGEALVVYDGSEEGPACIHYTDCEWSCTHGSHGP